MFSQNRDVNESDDHDSSIEHLGDVALRKKEFEILASKILPKLDDRAYDLQWGEVDMMCRKPYTILLGDYNLNLKGSGATDTFIDDTFILVKDANNEKHIVTVQTDLTTLKAKNKETQIIEGLKNNDAKMTEVFNKWQDDIIAGAMGLANIFDPLPNNLYL